VGAIESGSFGSVNVMPVTIGIGGTARSLVPSVGDTIERRIKELENGLAATTSCQS
jgi:metal-dependent amidase/aminoacylase/carboxypeptidase family protein